MGAEIKKTGQKTDDDKQAGHIKLAAEKILIFRAADEFFALPLTDISSIGEEVDAATLPQMPSFIEGILTVRGQMIPAIHLAKRLQLEVLEKTDNMRHIILKREKGQLALIVDELVEIMRFDSSNIQPVPEYLESTAHAPYIIGIFEAKQGVTSILDIKILFSKQQIDQLASFEQVTDLHKRRKGTVETGEAEKKKEKIEQIKNLIKTQLAPGASSKTSSKDASQVSPETSDDQLQKPKFERSKDKPPKEEKKDLKKTGT